MNKSVTLVNGEPFVSIGSLIMALLVDANDALDRGLFGDEGAGVVLAVIDALTVMGETATVAEPEPVIGQYL